MISAVCSFWAENTTHKKRLFKWGKKMLFTTAWPPFQGDFPKYIHGKKLSPSYLSQGFPKFQCAKAEEWITSNESRTIDAETMNMWNSHTDLSFLILKNSPYFEQEIGLFIVSQPVFIWSCLTCEMKTHPFLPNAFFQIMIVSWNLVSTLNFYSRQWATNFSLEDLCN